MAVLIGASWLKQNKFGSLNKNKKFDFTSSKEAYSFFRKENILEYEITNFRRMSETSKIFSLLTCFAFHDSAMKKIHEDTGIISCSTNGAFKDNIKFFSDYIEAGRKTARGNLFVYTLPTSTLGEVAISYKLKGPLFYLCYTEDSIVKFIRHANFMLESGQTQNLITIYSENNEFICMNFSTLHCVDNLKNIESIIRKLKPNSSISELISIL